jgi:hypothetical protein
MDILTERGQHYVAAEKKAIGYLRSVYPHSHIYHTPLESPSSLDLLSVRDNRLQSVAEVKCRDNSVEEFLRFDSLVLTWSKIYAMQSVAKALCVPGFVVLYIIPDDVVCVAPVVRSNGIVVDGITRRVTETKRSCNGGRAMRENGYIPIGLFGELEPNFF